MAFRMRLNGNHINKDLYKKLREASDIRTHGVVELVEAFKVNGDYRLTFVKVKDQRRRCPETVAGVTGIKDLGDGRFEITTVEGVKTFDGVKSVTKKPDTVAFKVTTSDGKTRGIGATRLFNLVHADIISEPERRAVWKAKNPSPAHAVPKVDAVHTEAKPYSVTPRSERFSKEDAKEVQG